MKTALARDLKMCGCDCETPDDFEQYYKGRFFAVPGSDGSLLPTTLVAYAKGADKCLLLQSYNVEEVQEQSYDWRTLRKVARFGIPVLGNVHYGDTYKYLWTYARRQSVKGLTTNNIMSWVPDKFGLARVQQRQFDNSLTLSTSAERKMLWEIYNPKFYGLVEAVDLLSQGQRIGCALDGKVGLHLSRGWKDICVSYRYRTVGHYSNSKIQLTRGFEHLVDVLKLSIVGVEIKA
jgi:hypothetical protein